MYSKKSFTIKEKTMKILIKLNKIFVFSFLLLTVNFVYSHKNEIVPVSEKIKTELNNKIEDCV